DEKRKNDMISDSVSADDMGKLPSSNLTEAASRIPGVSAVRNHFTGEGDRVVIRSMATEYNAYAVNGVRMGGTGSPNDNFFRGV
ncbi:TonB-dependent receptor plug domain-containing protein, partial [Acinetobacter baumannii]